jgi:hypothetical protein
MRGNVQSFHVFLARVCVLKDARVLAQELQALRRFL